MMIPNSDLGVRQRHHKHAEGPLCTSGHLDKGIFSIQSWKHQFQLTGAKVVKPNTLCGVWCKSYTTWTTLHGWWQTSAEWALTTTNTSGFHHYLRTATKLTSPIRTYNHRYSAKHAHNNLFCLHLYAMTLHGSRSTQNIHRCGSMQYMKTARIFFHIFNSC